MKHGTNNEVFGNEGGGEADLLIVGFEARPERYMIRPSGSFRHIAFHVQVGHKPTSASDRLPLNLALVLDRSGSMEGDKLEAAKRSALAVLDRLEESDQVAVVVFDDRVDLVQPAASATESLKAQVHSALAEIRARATTALHEGWLTGCQAIADLATADVGQRVSRCFLLTDGLANVGLTDPEKIAGEAAGVYEKAGIGTSTFGFGRDYSEALLGPMAVAGGGEFHHLRTLADINSAFVGELGDLFNVAAARARLEIETAPGVALDMISSFRVSPFDAGPQRWVVMLGDLLEGDERYIVVRFGFPGRRVKEELAVRARLVWTEGGIERSTEWREVRFTVAERAVCDAEGYDTTAVHWIGLHHAERVKRQAAIARQAQELEAARRDLRGVAQRIRRYAGSDASLLAAMTELETLADQLAEAPMEVMMAKEQYFQSQRLTRGQKDHRQA